MAELKRTSPLGVEYASSTTRPSSCAPRIKAVVTTLLEAIALVVLVVILFLQTWRASIIPLLAVPVSIIGTFA
jgi:multidrug efflux pump subunit AcrB